MKAVGYVWADSGPKLGNPAANIMGKEFAALAEDGRLTRSSIVTRARPDDSPLHKYFEWDNAKAAEKYREEQAGYYVRHLEVIVDRGGQAIQTKSFVSLFVQKSDEDGITDEGRHRFVSIERMHSDPPTREQVRLTLVGSLRAWMTRVHKLGFDSEFEPVLKVAEPLLPK